MFSETASLRVLATTLLIAVMKMPANLVQELLGHDDIETTLGLYTHPDAQMQRQMMDGLDDLFGTDFKRFTVNVAVKGGWRQQR